MNTDNKTSTVPLYKDLKSRITPGEWQSADNHVEGNNYNHTILSNGTKVVADVIRHNFKKFGKSKFKTKDKLNPCNEAKANAEYTALAVNNLHHIAEALENLDNAAICFTDDHAYYLEKGNFDKINSMLADLHNAHLKAKEALKRIS